MVKNITNAFRRNLVNVDWMDVSTKAKAFEKVNFLLFKKWESKMTTEVEKFPMTINMI